MPHMPTHSSGRAWREACAAISGRVSAFMSRSIVEVGICMLCYYIKFDYAFFMNGLSCRHMRSVEKARA